MNFIRLPSLILAFIFGFSVHAAPATPLATTEVQVQAPYKVEVYSYLFCGSCSAAKNILSSKKIEYEQHRIIFSGETEDTMHRRTFGEEGAPRIFINDQYIGTLSHLRALEAAGALDLIAQGKPAKITARKPTEG